MSFGFFVLKICNIIIQYSLHQNEELRKDRVFQIKVLRLCTKLHIFQHFFLHDIKLGWNGRQAALQSPECSKLKCKYANKFVRLDVIVLQPCFRLKSKHFEFNSFFSRLLSWETEPYNTTMKLGCEEDDDRKSDKNYFRRDYNPIQNIAGIAKPKCTMQMLFPQFNYTQFMTIGLLEKLPLH